MEKLFLRMVQEDVENQIEIGKQVNEEVTKLIQQEKEGDKVVDILIKHLEPLYNLAKTEGFRKLSDYLPGLEISLSQLSPLNRLLVSRALVRSNDLNELMGCSDLIFNLLNTDHKRLTEEDHRILEPA